MGSHIHRLLLGALPPCPSTPPPEAKTTGVGAASASDVPRVGAANRNNNPEPEHRVSYDLARRIYFAAKCLPLAS